MGWWRIYDKPHAAVSYGCFSIHSLASLCASAIWVGVIFSAVMSRKVSPCTLTVRARYERTICIGLNIVLRNTPTIIVHVAKEPLRTGMPLFGCHAVIFY